MEDLDLKQMSAMVQMIAEEKGLPEEVVLDVVQMAIAAAWRRDNGDRDMNVRALLDTNNGKAKIFVSREVIEDGLAYNPATEIPLEEAKKLDPEAEIGSTVEDVTEVTSFGRVAAMTAKQVVIQRLREAERDAVLSAFEDKIGTVVTWVEQLELCRKVSKLMVNTTLSVSVLRYILKASSMMTRRRS